MVKMLELHDLMMKRNFMKQNIKFNGRCDF